MPPDAAIRALAEDVRSVLETLWPDWHAARGRGLPTPPSRGTCQTSSLFLATCLNKAGWSAAVVQGNSPGDSPGAVPERTEGYLCSGTWHGHAWVLCGGWIVDITADQFGGPPVQIVRPEDPRYRPGKQDTATPEAIRFRSQLVKKGLSRWQASLDQSCSTFTDSET